MKKDGFAEGLQKTLADAQELSGLWTGTAIASKLDMEIEALKNSVENGNTETVTNELHQQLKETVKFADEELQKIEG